LQQKKYDLIVFFEANRRFGYRFQGLIEKLLIFLLK